ncbi:MAG: hypothetical protein IPN77_01630 [Sandaracinaceae bacterium]|nr:hypothetical protein [Sandaracinaceae bacterium]
MLPAATTDGVVAWLLGGAARSWPDEQGRPLGEQASPRYATTPRREELRPFGDARDASGLPCNVAALAQLHATWPMLLAALSAFDAEQPDTLARTLRRISAGVRLGPLLALCTRAPVPVAVAALHKVTLGFSDLCAAMLLEVRVDADQPAPGDHVLHAWLQERPWLIGNTQVCAGSRAQITRVWQGLRETGAEQPITALSAPWFREALDALLELEALAAGSAGHTRRPRARAAGWCRWVCPVHCGRSAPVDGGAPTGSGCRSGTPQLALRQRRGAALAADVRGPRGHAGRRGRRRGAAGCGGGSAHRLAHWLGLDATSPLTAAAFLDACSVGEARPVG